MYQFYQIFAVFFYHGLLLMAMCIVKGSKSAVCISDSILGIARVAMQMVQQILISTYALW